MSQRRLARAWQAVKSALKSRELWLMMAWFALALVGVFGLAWFATRQFDTFLRLKPLLCESGIGNRQFLVVAVLAPLALVFALSAFGELWLIREARRAGHPVRWRHFLWFVGVAVVCAVAVFQALGC